MHSTIALIAVALIGVAACSASDSGVASNAGSGGIGIGGKGGTGGTGGGIATCKDSDCTAPEKCGAGSGVCLAPGACMVNGDCAAQETCNSTTKKCEIGTGCGNTEFSITQIAPNVMILLDRSGSMEGDAGGDTRWNVAKKAISQVTTSYENEIRFGLATYSSCLGGGCSAGSIVVPIADQNAAAINGFLATTIDQGSSNGQGTSGGFIQYLCDSGDPETSTGKSLAALVGEASLQDGTRQNIVILLTDGAESSECVGSCDGPCGAGQLLAQTPSVKTYVIGLGVGASAIDQIAQSGGTTQSIPSNNQTELDNAFKQVASAVASCDYVLDTAPPGTDKIFVYFNDDPAGVTSDGTNGWTYDPTTKKLEFHGTSCDQIKSGTITDIDVVYGCPGPIVG